MKLRMVVALVLMWVVGCGALWRADSVSYTGKPGVLLEAGGARFYVGLEGTLLATGSAESGDPADAEGDGE